jgi:hypothetical protein
VDEERDRLIRLAAFDHLSRLVAAHGDVLPRGVLQAGFPFEGRTVRLIGPQGIFTPAGMEAPLSITTAPDGPYDDAVGDDGFLRYRYRGTDPQHRDNVGLLRAMERGLPLVYFAGITRGSYGLRSCTRPIPHRSPSTSVYTSPAWCGPTSRPTSETRLNEQRLRGWSSRSCVTHASALESCMRIANPARFVVCDTTSFSMARTSFP